MKYLIVLGLVLATAYAKLDEATEAALMEEFKQVGATCIGKEGATNDDLNLILNKQIPTTKPGQCLIACFNEYFEIQSPDGTFNKDGAIKAIEVFKADADTYTKMQTVVERCGTEVVPDGDRCNTALALATCEKKVATEIGLEDSAF